MGAQSFKTKKDGIMGKLLHTDLQDQTYLDILKKIPKDYL